MEIKGFFKSFGRVPANCPKLRCGPMILSLSEDGWCSWLDIKVMTYSKMGQYEDGGVAHAVLRMYTSFTMRRILIGVGESSEGEDGQQS